MSKRRVSLGLGVLALAALSTGVIAREGATVVDDGLKARLTVLTEDFQKANREHRNKVSMTGDPAQRMALLQEEPWLDYLPKFEAIAKEASGTEIGASAWSAIFSNGVSTSKADRSWEAFEILTHDYLDSESLQSAIQMVEYYGEGKTQAVDGLERIASDSALRENRGKATFTLGRLLMGNVDTREKAREKFLLVTMDYADLKGDRGKSYGELAEINLFDLDNLQVGCKVPEFESIDETGTPFKLSEYEGKVVLLDFWGFW